MSARIFSQEGTKLRRGTLVGTMGALGLIGVTIGLLTNASPQAPAAPATPIQHLVVVYGENISFDHYFGTYPNATNVAGEPSFTAQSGTPTPNNYVSNPTLLTDNPNFTNSANGSNAINPFRLDRTQAASGDQNHSYTPEQQAADGGAMDLFPKDVGNGTTGGSGAFGTKGLTMGYYDGNTVTAWWNYAQNFSMSDNSFGDQYGPSTPGALNVVSGQTNGMNIVHQTSTTFYVNDTQGGLTEINDADPAYDTCSIAANGNEVYLTGKNIGDLLNAANITWGSFMGGFNLNLTNANGTTGCARSTFSTVVGAATADYVQHHAWFQYYATTVNPDHARPSSVATIGHSFLSNGVTPEPANHEYDLQDFYAAVSAGNFPAVSFIKMPVYQDGHAGYSDPLDEQAGVVALVNFLQQQPAWSNTAVIIAYDDSDGWYDHVFATTTSSSYDATADQLNGASVCGTGTQQNGVGGNPVNGRCGPGPRLPFVVISPWAKPNYVSHVQISQVSVTKFIEDNWLSGTRLGGGSFDANAGSIMDFFNFGGSGTVPRRFLNPTTGNRSPALSHDFIDGGFSDILWRDNSGNMALWEMNGGTITNPSSSGVGGVATTWSIVGQRDFNGDGNADILWHDTSGNLAIWEMNGTTLLNPSATGLGAVPTAWSVVGTGDFNGDGSADILWRNTTTGDMAIWEMNGTTILNPSATGVGTVATNWNVVGVGDFNGDGKADILWQNTSNGNLAIYLMNGTTVTSSATFANPGAYSVVGIGDFNGDGKSDILLRDGSGDIAIWEMNGTTITNVNSAGVGNLSSVWSVAETGDFNGDGMSDILWRDTSGDIAIWFMNGTTLSSSAGLGTISTTFTIQGTNAD
jgi:phospholipase C